MAAAGVRRWRKRMDINMGNTMQHEAI